MDHRAITALLSGVEVEQGQSRFVRWWLDGQKVTDVSLNVGAETAEYTFKGVAYRATHKIVGQVWDRSTDNLLATSNITIEDPLKLWSWTESNGTATDEETLTAYTALTSRGMTVDFRRAAWNDLVSTELDVVELLGQSWWTSYSTYEDMLLTDADNALTADRFNAFVQNLQTQYPYWRYQTDRKGYLGRLYVKGMSTAGQLADIVYGEYLLELAHLLNVTLDAELGTGAGYATLLDHTAQSAITTWARLPLRTPGSRRLALDDTLPSSSGQTTLRAPASRHLVRVDDIKTVPKLVGSAPPAVHINLKNRVRSVRSFDFIAQNERPMELTELLGSAVDLLLAADPATALAIAQVITSTAAAALAPVSSLPLGAVLASLTAPSVTLTPSPSTYLLADVDTVSRLDGTLTAAEESALTVLAKSLTGSNTVLTPDEATALAHIWAVQSAVESITLGGAVSRHLAHRGKATTKAEAALRAALAANMAHTAKDLLTAKLTAILRAPKSARMSHEAALKLASKYTALLAADPAIHMAYSGEEKITAKFLAELRAPRAARMTYTAEEAVATKLLALLAADESRPMSYTAKESVATKGEAALTPAESKPLSAELTAPDGRTDAELTPVDSLPLDIIVTETLDDVCDATLDPVESTELTVSSASESGAAAELEPLPSAPAAHRWAVDAQELLEMRAPDAADSGVVSVIITVLTAALEARPNVEPTTDWATQEGTNLDIRRTYYNRVDDADGSVLLIDQAWYQEPVQVAGNLAITSEGYNDYGLEGTDENTV